MTQLKKERRAHTRTQAPELPLTLVGSDNVLRVRDISQSGVAFFAESPVPLMTKVHFEIQLPNGAETGLPVVSGEGAVVRCERLSPALGHYEVAIFFQQLEGNSVANLKNYMGNAKA